ncbi:hypothetical protein SAMN02745196_00721 [Clostridium collagenovorans DSM 3089]|uniref:Homoserine dehydrogenase, NAD binding domain n=1 Tax=Clostridium collagenovorans DSM 3089 TaxID=1121306 RepID=A0A1M5TUC2_9CLOT|nr:hypothetical protein [Clostridium collagenovorans]SHH54372.1 hypothetical protein SAMN02745196_00721 [Clostridium collagenovorans DSM 3089]
MVKILIVGIGEATKELLKYLFKENRGKTQYSVEAIVDYNLKRIKRGMEEIDDINCIIYREFQEIENTKDIDLILVDIDVYGENLEDKLEFFKSKDIVLISNDNEYIYETHKKLYEKLNVEALREKRFILCTSIHKKNSLFNIENLIKYVLKEEQLNYIKVICDLKHLSCNLSNFFALNITEEEFYENNIDKFFIENSIMKRRILRIYGELYKKTKEFSIREELSPIISNTFRDGKLMSINEGNCAGFLYEISFFEGNEKIFRYIGVYEFITEKESKAQGMILGKEEGQEPVLSIKLDLEGIIYLDLLGIIIKNKDLVGKGVLML